MIKRQPLRIRLMLWYSLALASALLIFAFLIWAGLRQSLLSSREDALRQRVRALNSFFQHEDTDEILTARAEEFSTTLPSDTRFQLLDTAGTVLYTSHAKPMRRFLLQSGTLNARDQICRMRMYISLDPVDEMLGQLLLTLALSIPLALLVAAAGGWMLTRRTLAPIQAMAEAARSITALDLTIRIPVPPAKDELRLLAEMWNAMLGRLEDSVHKIRRFTADASHDLRTPLSAISLTAEVSLRRTRDAATYQEALQRILAQSGRATTLVSDLLTLARADSGETVFLPEPVELRSLIRQACEGLVPLADSKGLSLQFELPPQPVWFYADPAAVERLTIILVENAVKNTAAGHVLVRVTDSGETVVLEVEDSGCGIEREDTAHVFERFYRGDESRGSATGGSGLGLSIARWIVELHRGTITFESQPGQGTCFRVTLPHDRTT